MDRVVHVLDPLGDWREGRSRGAPAIASMACAAAIAATPELEHVVVVLGGASEASAASRAGLCVRVCAAVPVGEARLAWRTVRRALRPVIGGAVVQAWSDRALTACGAAGVGAAAPLSGVLPGLGCAPKRDRGAVRREVGLCDEAPLVGLLAEPAGHADARRFVFMIGLLDVAGIPVAGLVGPATAHLRRARRFHREAGVRWRMLLPERSVVELLDTCDLAVVVPPSPHRELSRCEREWVRWSIARAHMLGVPVVAGSAWLDGALCPDGARAALGAEGMSITDLGRKLGRLVGDAGERARMGGLVRAHVAEHVDGALYGSALREHWLASGLALRPLLGAGAGR